MTKSKKIRIRIDAKIGELLHEITKEFPEANLQVADIIALEAVEQTNKHLHFKRELNATHKVLSCLVKYLILISHEGCDDWRSRHRASL